MNATKCRSSIAATGTNDERHSDTARLRADVNVLAATVGRHQRLLDERNNRLVEGMLESEPVVWGSLDQADEAGALEVVARFVAWLVCRYELDHQHIPECWAQHGAYIEELSALSSLWTDAYHHTRTGMAAVHFHNQLAAFFDRTSRHWRRVVPCELGSHRARRSNWESS
jgi:hypothetical protein